MIDLEMIALQLGTWVITRRLQMSCMPEQHSYRNHSGVRVKGSLEELYAI